MVAGPGGSSYQFVGRRDMIGTLVLMKIWAGRHLNMEGVVRAIAVR